MSGMWNGKKRIVAILGLVVLLGTMAAVFAQRIDRQSGDGTNVKADDATAGQNGAGQIELHDRAESVQGVDEQEVTTDLEPEEPEPTTDPHEADAVSGAVGYDDIPDPSQIEGEYEADDIKDAIIRYMQKEYPSDVIESIRLLGNGASQSQEVDEMASYMCYLVTIGRGQDIGLFVQCSDSEAPHVTETGYLVISPTLLYDVGSREYIPMDVPDGEELAPSQDDGAQAEPVPPEGGYPDPYALPEPGTEKDRMRRLPIPADVADPDKMSLG